MAGGRGTREGGEGGADVPQFWGSGRLPTPHSYELRDLNSRGPSQPPSPTHLLREVALHRQVHRALHDPQPARAGGTHGGCTGGRVQQRQLAKGAAGVGGCAYMLVCVCVCVCSKKHCEGRA